MKARGAIETRFVLSEEDVEDSFCAVVDVQDVNKLLALADERSPEGTMKEKARSGLEVADLESETAALEVQCMCWSDPLIGMIGVSTMDARITVYKCSWESKERVPDADGDVPVLTSGSAADIENKPIDWDAITLVDKSRTLHDGNRIMGLCWRPYCASDPVPLLASVSKKVQLLYRRT